MLACSNDDIEHSVEFWQIASYILLLFFLSELKLVTLNKTACSLNRCQLYPTLLIPTVLEAEMVELVCTLTHSLLLMN